MTKLSGTLLTATEPTELEHVVYIHPTIGGLTNDGHGEGEAWAVDFLFSVAEANESEANYRTQKWEVKNFENV